jgi:hypothetical protein
MFYRRVRILLPFGGTSGYLVENATPAILELLQDLLLLGKTDQIIR